MNADNRTVDRKLLEAFPAQEQRGKAAVELARYGTETYERESERVRLAILKLGGSSLEEIALYVDQAKSDYRDVLAWAESPLEMKLGPNVVGPRRHAAQQKDREQYRKWLETE